MDRTTQWKGVVPDIVLPDLYADELVQGKSQQQRLATRSTAGRAFISHRLHCPFSY